MKKHFLKCGGIKDTCEKMDSQGSKLSKPHGSGKSSSKPKKDKKDKKDKDDKCGEKEKDDKPCRSESKSGNKAASQEQVLESLHHCSLCIAESTAEGSHHITRVTRSPRSVAKSLHKSHKKTCQ